MVKMQLATAGVSAVVVPPLVAPLIGGIPGGAFAVGAIGALIVWLGSQMDGLGAGIVVGAGAGLVGAAVLAFMAPQGRRVSA